MVAVCGLCGGARSATPDPCFVCGARDPSTPTMNAAWPDGACWARVEARFACVSCGQLSPQNHLDLDGAVTCAHCGFDQPLDPRAWGRPLAFAHEVVDLSAVAPWVLASETLRSHRNPHATVGSSIPAREWTETGAVAGRERLQVRVAPGHPL